MWFIKTILFSLIFFVFLNAYSQEQENDLPKIFYRNERTISLNIFSNGWGLGYRYGERLNYFEKRVYEVDLSIVKHSKEVKSSSTLFNPGSYVFGKLNFVADLRVGIGKQNEIFGKRDPGSISVKYFYTFGPSIAFKKPVYYEIYNDTGDSIAIQKFNADIHDSGNIKGSASFFEGIDEIKVVPGLYFKGGFNFEFSQSETLIHTIEIGAIVQAYLNSLELMDVDDNQQLFIALFASYRFGKIINAQQLSEEYLKKRKKKFRLL